MDGSSILPLVAGWTRTIDRRNRMTTLSMSEDFAVRELSIEALEAIAAGWPKWVHSAVNWVEHHPFETALYAGGIALGVAVAVGNPAITLSIVR
jgi:hypothetical protein